LPDPADPTATADFPVGVSEINMSGDMATLLAVGAFFSDGQDYLYRVESNTLGAIRFNPPLRRAISSGESLRVSRPRIRVRLATDQDFRAFIEASRVSNPIAVNFTEVFRRDEVS
jgi:hypothetical protein